MPRFRHSQCNAPAMRYSMQCSLCIILRVLRYPYCIQQNVDRGLDAHSRCKIHSACLYIQHYSNQLFPAQPPTSWTTLSSGDLLLLSVVLARSPLLSSAVRPFVRSFILPHQSTSQILYKETCKGTSVDSIKPQVARQRNTPGNKSKQQEGKEKHAKPCINRQNPSKPGQTPSTQKKP